MCGISKKGGCRDSPVGEKHPQSRVGVAFKLAGSLCGSPRNVRLGTLVGCNQCWSLMRFSASFANQDRVQFHLLGATPCPSILFGTSTLPSGALGKSSEHLAMSPHILALKWNHVRGLQGLHPDEAAPPACCHIQHLWP